MKLSENEIYEIIDRYTKEMTNKGLLSTNSELRGYNISPKSPLKGISVRYTT